MPDLLNPAVIFLLIGSLAALGASIYAWQDRKNSSTALPLTGLLLSSAVFCFATAMNISGTQAAGDALWSKVSYVGWALIPPLFLVFAMQYTRWDRWVEGWRLPLLFVIPVVTLLLVFTNEFHLLIWGDPKIPQNSAAYFDTRGAWWYVHMGSSYLYLLAGTLPIIIAFFTAHGIYRLQSGLVLMGTAVAWIGSGFYVLGILPYYSAALSFVIGQALYVLATLRFKLTDLNPIAYSEIVENIRDGLLIIGKNNLVISANPVALHITGLSASEIVGKSMETLFQESHRLKMESQGSEVRQEVAVGEADEKEYYELRFSPIRDDAGEMIGQLLLARNITEQRRLREQEIDYRLNVSILTEAASAIHAGTFELKQLDPVTARKDALGELARVFKDMANQVYMREKALKAQVQELQIHLNETKQGQQVEEIVGSEYFKELKKIVKKNRARKKPDQKA